MAAVTNLLYLLRQTESWDERAHWYVAQAERELARVTHVARQTLGFYRDTTSPCEVNLSKTVDEVVSLYLPRIESRKIKLASDFDPENRDENIDYYVAKLDDLVKKFGGVGAAKAEQATLL